MKYKAISYQNSYYELANCEFFSDCVVHNDNTEFSDETVIPIEEVVIVELDVPVSEMTREEYLVFLEKQRKDWLKNLKEAKEKFLELYPEIPKVKGMDTFWSKYDEKNGEELSQDPLGDVMRTFDSGEEIGFVLEPYGVSTREYLQYALLERERLRKWKDFYKD